MIKEYWVARTRFGELTIWKEKPERNEGMGVWTFGKGQFKSQEQWIKDTMDLDPEMFPSLKWEDEPLRVKMILLPLLIQK